MSPSAEQAVDMLVPVLVIDIDMRRIDICLLCIVSDADGRVKDYLCHRGSSRHRPEVWRLFCFAIPSKARNRLTTNKVCGE
jgi:hypothetical protein